MKHLNRAFSSLSVTVALGVALSSLIPAFAQSTSQSTNLVAPQTRITQTTNEQNLVRLSGNTSPLVKIGSDLGVATDSFPLNHLQLVLKRSDVQEAALEQLLKDQQHVGSPSYHQWLTPQSFGETYGVSAQDLSTVTAWLSGHGFSVEKVSNSHMVITFSGTQQQLRSAFHTEIHHYSLHGQTYFANTTDPMLPAALSPVIAGFSTLSNYGPKPLHTSPQLMKHMASGEWQKTAIKPQAESNMVQKVRPDFTINTGTNNAYLVAPSDFATIYNVNPLWSQGIDGTGQTIAIVAASDVNPADVDAFRSAFGLPAKKLNYFYIDENPGLTADSTESEAALDVEWSGAMAKNATIDVVVSENGPLPAAQYAIDNNLAPVLSVSWGECELDLGVSGNQYVNTMWQQGAAEGITVLVAAGDSGSASCDQGEELSFEGEQVSGFASTPYNTAVGGTDFSGNYPHAAPYWSLTNNSTTLESAIGYIPETPWNETCASPQVLLAAEANGFAADTTNEALCNDFTQSTNFLDVVGGGGGTSLCTSSDGTNVSSCTGGYPTPDWQLPMPGMPKNTTRNVPDISFFAGSGIWGSAYVFCQSDVSPDGACNYLNTADIQTLTAGGTSFASPAFAGVVALMNQKTKSALGNINYLLYQLGAAQYNGTGATVFHDIIAGNNAMPCLAGNPAVPPSTPCTVTNPNDVVGVLPDYSTNVGYDRASGLGSADVTSLASAWAAVVSGLAPSKTTLTLTGSATETYGTAFTAKVQVSAATGSTVPTGGAAIFYEDTASGLSLATGQLANGVANLSGNTMPAGKHNLVARYPGNGTFSESSSTTVPIVVTQAGTTMTLTSSHTTVSPTQSVSFEITLETNSTANSPSGSVTLTDTTTGNLLGTATVAAETDASGNSIGHAFLNVPGNQLGSGQNTIAVNYPGDTNYTGSSTKTVITYTSAFQIALGQSAIALPAGTKSSGAVSILVTPGTGTVLNLANLTFSCPVAMPVGLTCSFSAPVLNSNGTVSSNVTLLASAPLASMTKPAFPGKLAGEVVALACLVFFGLPGKKRNIRLFAVVCSAGVLFAASGCSSNQNSIQANNAATITALSSSSKTPSLNSTLTLTSQVTPISGSGSPTGSVTFLSGTNVLGVSTLSGGKAIYSTSSLSIGAHTLTASYSGDSSFTPSDSGSTGVDVTLIAPIAIQVSDNAGDVANQTLTITIQ